jgi:hypothetical protein
MIDLSNLPLADQFAILKADIDVLTKQMDAVKEAIKATGKDVVEGNTSIVTVNLYETTVFDSKVAKTFLTEEQVAACTRKSDVYRMTAKPKNKITVLA